MAKVNMSIGWGIYITQLDVKFLDNYDGNFSNWSVRLTTLWEVNTSQDITSAKFSFISAARLPSWLYLHNLIPWGLGVYTWKANAHSDVWQMILEMRNHSRKKKWASWSQQWASRKNSEKKHVAYGLLSPETLTEATHDKNRECHRNHLSTN